jgi:hypothetical protein
MAVEVVMAAFPCPVKSPRADDPADPEIYMFYSIHVHVLRHMYDRERTVA